MSGEVSGRVFNGAAGAGDAEAKHPEGHGEHKEDGHALVSLRGKDTIVHGHGVATATALPSSGATSLSKVASHPSETVEVPKAPPVDVIRVPFQPPGLPAPPHDTRLQEQLARLLELASTIDGHWNLHSAKEGVTTYTHVDRTPAARGDGFLPFPRRAIKELLVDAKHRANMDTQLDKEHIVEKWNVHSAIAYMKFKGMLLVQSRDFCNLTHWRVDEDGNLFIVAWSTTDPRCPENSGAVRAHLEIGGWVIRPRPGAAHLRKLYAADIEAGRRPPPFLDPEIDSEGCDCTYLMRSDFKGSIPMAITSKVAPQQALIVHKVRDVLAEVYKPGGEVGPSGLAALKSCPLVNEGQPPWTAASHTV